MSVRKSFLVMAVAFAASSAFARFIFVAPGAVEYDPKRDSANKGDEEEIVKIEGRNGDTWDSAYPDLQSALNHAHSGDLVCVKAGEYHFDRPLDWPGDGVATAVIGGLKGKPLKPEDRDPKPFIDINGMGEWGGVTKFVFDIPTNTPPVAEGGVSYWASFANIESNIELPYVWISPCMDVMRCKFPAKIDFKVSGDGITAKTGEEITITYNVDWWVKAGRLQLIRKGDDGEYFEDLFETDKGPIVYKTTMKQPGSLIIDTVLLGEDGNRIGPRGYGDGEYWTHTALMVDGDKLGPDDKGLPTDFAEFWQKALKEVRAAKAGKLEPVKNKKNVFAYSLPAPGGVNAAGYIGIPAGAAAKSLAAYMTLPDYGPKQKAEPMPKAKEGRIEIRPSIHGDAQAADGYFVNRPNAYPEKSDMYGIICRLLRTVEELKNHKEWNGELYVDGFGQGGYLALVLGALEGDSVKFVDAYAPWLVDLSYTRLGRMGGWNPTFTKGSRYYDGCAFAALCKVPTLLRSGMNDTTVTASGVLGAYNRLKGPKKIELYQGIDHRRPPEGFAGKVITKKSGDWKER